MRPKNYRTTKENSDKVLEQKLIIVEHEKRKLYTIAKHYKQRNEQLEKQLSKFGFILNIIEKFNISLSFIKNKLLTLKPN